MQYINSFSQKRDKVSIAITFFLILFFVFLDAPQGAILCPLFCLIYINHLSNKILNYQIYQINAKTDDINSALKANMIGHS